MLRVVLVVGAAVLCCFAALVLTVIALFFLHSNIGFQSCSSSLPNGPWQCSPPSWEWESVFGLAAAVGAMSGGAGTVMWMRHRDRLRDKSVAPQGQ